MKLPGRYPSESFQCHGVLSCAMESCAHHTAVATTSTCLPWRQSFHNVCDNPLQRLACWCLKFIFGRRIAARATCALRTEKTAKARILLEGLWTLKIGREDPAPFSCQTPEALSRQTDRQSRPRCHLIHQMTFLGYEEYWRILKYWSIVFLIHCIPTNFDEVKQTTTLPLSSRQKKTAVFRIPTSP